MENKLCQNHVTSLKMGPSWGLEMFSQNKRLNLFMLQKYLYIFHYFFISDNIQHILLYWTLSDNLG